MNGWFEMILSLGISQWFFILASKVEWINFSFEMKIYLNFVTHHCTRDQPVPKYSAQLRHTKNMFWHTLCLFDYYFFFCQITKIVLNKIIRHFHKFYYFHRAPCLSQFLYFHLWKFSLPFWLFFVFKFSFLAGFETIYAIPVQSEIELKLRS